MVHKGENIQSQELKDEFTNRDADENKRIFNTLKAVQEESSQLIELKAEERRLVTELCRMLSKVMTFLDVSVSSMEAEKLAKITPGATNLTLNRQCLVIAKYPSPNGDGLDSKPLENYPLEAFVEILRFASPLLAKLAMDQRQKATHTIGFLEKISRELHKVERIAEAEAEESHDLPIDALTKAMHK